MANCRPGYEMPIMACNLGEQLEEPESTQHKNLARVFKALAKTAKTISQLTKKTTQRDDINVPVMMAGKKKNPQATTPMRRQQAPRTEETDEELFEVATAATVQPQVVLQQVMIPRTFKGGPLESVEDWVEHFVTYSRVNQWSEDDMARRFPAYLDGSPSVWFAATFPDPKTATWPKIQASLKQAFGCVKPHLAHFTDMNKRVMSLTERFSDYYYDKLRKLNLVNPKMPDQDKLNHLIQGLTPILYNKIFSKNISSPNELFKACKLAEEGFQLANSRPDWNAEAEKAINAAFPAPRRQDDNRSVRFSTEQDRRPNHGKADNDSNWRDRGPPQRSSAPQRRQEQRQDRVSQFNDGLCFYCQEAGHQIRQCRLRQEDIADGRPNARRVPSFSASGNDTRRERR